MISASRSTSLFAALAALVAATASCGADVQTGGSSGAGGAGGGSACSAFIAPKNPTWSKTTVRLRNSTAAPLYLGSQGGCGLVPFDLQDPNGGALTWQLAPCALTCEAEQNGACACGLDCALPPVFLIPPGGAFETTWEGSIFVKANMPAACYKDPTCAAAGCLVKQAAPKGVLEVSASLWSSVTNCPAGMSCTCDPGTAGFCQIAAPASVGGAQHTASAKLTYPDDKLIEVVFQ